MKIAGAALIIISSGLLGLDFYKKCTLKLSYIQGLIDGFEYIKNEIAFTKPVLCETISNASEFSGLAKKFFKQIGQYISEDGVSLEEAFENSKNHLKTNTCKTTYLTVNDVIIQLGTSDTENQINLLSSTVNKLKADYNTQKAFCEKEGVMCKKIGLVLGVAVSILLF